MIRRQVIASLRMLAVMTLLLGIAYPLAVAGISQVAMSGRANGSLVSYGGRVVGSSLIGQRFDGPEWFHGRPDAFDPMVSGPSNLGPSNPQLAVDVREELAKVRTENGLATNAPVPADAVTTSGSGLDPDISVAYALLQVPRIAQVRGLSVPQVDQLVQDHVAGRTFGFIGEPHVNVLELNVALQRVSG